jgi:hypothetical protein
MTIRMGALSSFSDDTEIVLGKKLAHKSRPEIHPDKIWGSGSMVPERTVLTIRPPADPGRWSGMCAMVSGTQYVSSIRQISE